MGRPQRQVKTLAQIAEELAQSLDKMAKMARALRDTLETIDDYLHLKKDHETWIPGVSPFEERFIDILMSRGSVTFDQLVLLLWGAKPEHERPRTMKIRLSQAARRMRAHLNRLSPGLAREFIVTPGSAFGPTVYQFSPHCKALIRQRHEDSANNEAA